MVKNQTSSFTLKTVIECIARGHAFDKHVLGYDVRQGMAGVNAFRAENTNSFYDAKALKWSPPKPLGRDLFIETPDDLIDYITNDFLVSPDTHGYVTAENGGGISLFNTRDKVAMHLTWNDKNHDFGSIFRYPETHETFMNLAEAKKNRAADLGLPFQTINNQDNPNTVIQAVEVMLVEINANPQNYLFIKDDKASTAHTYILGNKNRPGRGWDCDEVLFAPHNLRGHSEVYAQAKGLDISPEKLVCIKEAREKELNIGRARKTMRSGRVLDSIKLDSDFEMPATPSWSLV